MEWFFALLALALALGWWMSNRRLARQVQEMEKLADGIGSDLPASDEPPEAAGRFSGLARRLEEAAAEQRRLREQIRREEFNFRTILSSMQEGLMLVDARHVIQLVNPSFRQLFDLKAEPVGDTVMAVLRDTTFAQTVAAALRTGEPQAREVTLEGAKPLRHFSVNAAPMRDSAGDQGVLMIFRDISRLKQLEDVRREFVANVSHELRTPLAIFHGYLETVMDNPALPAEELQGILQIMRKHSLRLNALLEDLLILARLESRSAPLQIEAIELPQFLQEIIDDWALQSAEKQITIELQAPSEFPPLMADALRLEQVLNNLIGNAVKYTGTGGRVIISVAAAGEEMELRVEDNGAGIAPADLPHIFERFYRAEKARTREQGGTGLGLSIVKHIVQTHGGTVTAESTYGKGTRIILRLPWGRAGE